jgi:hypothetical protein
VFWEHSDPRQESGCDARETSVTPSTFSIPGVGSAAREKPPDPKYQVVARLRITIG